MADEGRLVIGPSPFTLACWGLSVKAPIVLQPGQNIGAHFTWNQETTPGVRLRPACVRDPTDHDFGLCPIERQPAQHGLCLDFDWLGAPPEVRFFSSHGAWRRTNQKRLSTWRRMLSKTAFPSPYTGSPSGCRVQSGRRWRKKQRSGCGCTPKTFPSRLHRAARLNVVPLGFHGYPAYFPRSSTNRNTT